jgi:HAD superfamily hydrolase (TIGR01490 family)
MAVAADLEGTLTTGESWRAVAEYLITHGKRRAYRQFFLKRLPAALWSYTSVKQKRRFATRWMYDLAGFFAGMTDADMAELATWVVEEVLWPNRREEVIAALKVHQATGERLVISSGTYQPILESFARKLGARALGTPLEIIDGKLTGKVLGSVNVEQVKAARLHELLGEERLYAAYGNTEADIPMLMLSDRPIAVYPDKLLRSTARTLGWTVFET